MYIDNFGEDLIDEFILRDDEIDFKVNMKGLEKDKYEKCLE